MSLSLCIDEFQPLVDTSRAELARIAREANFSRFLTCSDRFKPASAASWLARRRRKTICLSCVASRVAEPRIPEDPSQTEVLGSWDRDWPQHQRQSPTIRLAFALRRCAVLLRKSHTRRSDNDPFRAFYPPATVTPGCAHLTDPVHPAVPARSRATPSDPERSRAIPSDPERSRGPRA